MKLFLHLKKGAALTLLMTAILTTAFGQSTDFSYQGFLNDNNASANGNFDFEFRLYSAAAGGTLEGTVQRLNVTVVNGVFNVALDFGAGGFPGADRFLEISVRPAGNGGFTTLSPRQKVSRTPYSITSGFADQAAFAINATAATSAQTSVNSLQLGGIAANQFVQTNDPRLNDSRNPLPNSPSYIQNRTTQQTSTNFNISGNGTVGGNLTGNVVTSQTGFNIGNNRVLQATNTFNVLVGLSSGGSISSGVGNTFTGSTSGAETTTGSNNSFFGFAAGTENVGGSNNSFFGLNAGIANVSGSNNTIVGYLANLGSGNLTNASAFGNRAFVETSNALILGSVAGKNGATTDVKVGIGTTSPDTTLEIEGEVTLPMIRLTNFTRYSVISGRSSNGSRSFPLPSLANQAMFIIGADGYSGAGFTQDSAATIQFNSAENWTPTANGTSIWFTTTVNGSTNRLIRMAIENNGNVGIGTTTPAQRLDVSGNVRIGTGSTGCIEDRDGTVIAGICSSDLRFKKDIKSFNPVLQNFSKLRPVNYEWRADEFAEKNFGRKTSFGLIAQEVEELFPDLVTTDEQGYKSINYSKLPLLTVQAVTELKAENDALKAKVDEQEKQLAEIRREIEELKKSVKPAINKPRKAKKGAKRS